MKNDVTNEVTLVESDDTLQPNEGIGLWIQRDLKAYKYPTNEQLVEDFKNKVINSDTETAEIVISYNLVEKK